MFFTNILDEKIVDDEDEGDGLGMVLELARCRGDGA